jgi:hypothetical protein
LQQTVSDIAEQRNACGASGCDRRQSLVAEMAQVEEDGSATA